MRRHFNFRGLSRRWKIAVLAAVTMVVVAVPVAWASDVFSDVPNSNPHHNNINTIARAGITGGCAPGFYCPANAVRRDEMGTFLAKMLKVMTPVLLEDSLGTGALDPDAAPVVCDTGSHTPTVTERAFLHGWVAATAAGAMSYRVNNMFSTDGGTTWNLAEGGGGFARAGVDGGGEWTEATNLAVMTLNPGTTYRFGIEVSRQAGTADITDHRCEKIAEITYFDNGASSLGASLETSGPGDGH